MLKGGSAAWLQVPALKHLKDVLVLAAQGSRSEADRSSGGELGCAIIPTPVRHQQGACNSIASLCAKSWECRPQLGQAVMFSVVCYTGDYDGDKAFVTWHEPLIPAVVAEPPGYLPDPAVPSSKIGEPEIVSYFAAARFSAALLGRLNAYFLFWADSKGADCEECVAISQIFAKGVDSVKSGQRQAVPQHLIPPPEVPAQSLHKGLQ
eukprot:1159936-Pelagomonas_calceolata.AAC.14